MPLELSTDTAQSLPSVAQPRSASGTKVKARAWRATASSWRAVGSRDHVAARRIVTETSATSSLSRQGPGQGPEFQTCKSNPNPNV